MIFKKSFKKIIQLETIIKNAKSSGQLPNNVSVGPIGLLLQAMNNIDTTLAMCTALAYLEKKASVVERSHETHSKMSIT